MLKRLSIACILLIVLSAFVNASEPFPYTENVLTDGMTITARTPSGKISIKGGKGCLREYAGENWSKKSNLIPRNMRWYGSLGLYDPADSDTMNGRLIVDEGRQFFASESEALRYFQRLSGYYGRLTYNNSGLLIAYKIVDVGGGEPTRSLTIWQIYINGKKPSSLRGAIDNTIEITGGLIPDTATLFQAKVGYERAIADKEYDPRN
jgi:hypothetical protein